MKKYTYLILLLVTCLIGMPFAVKKIYASKPVATEEKETVVTTVHERSVENGAFDAAGKSAVGGQINQDGITIGINEADQKQTAEENTDMENTESENTEAENVVHSNKGVNDGNIEEEPSQVPPAFTQVDRNYFSDALFIGDSRTMGLEEYADLGGADIFAASGMSVFEIFDSKNAVSGSGTYLKDMLSGKTYGKIYFMMGINDLGYPAESLTSKYREVVTAVKSMQPDARFFLEANMHVTAKKSAGDTIFNNDNINRLNGLTEALAAELGCIYININEKFDDSSGALSADVTFDEVHVLGKYYEQWADWICTKGVL